MSDGVYLWFLLQNEITITAQQYVNLIQVAIAQGFHLFPFRTEKLSLVTPMVLRNSGRVGSRRFLRSPLIHFESRGFLCFGTLRKLSIFSLPVSHCRIDLPEVLVFYEFGEIPIAFVI